MSSYNYTKHTPYWLEGMDEKDMTPGQLLILHMYRRNIREFCYVLSVMNADPNIIYEEDADRTPLMIASTFRYRNDNIIRFLLRYGADINIINSRGANALFIASIIPSNILTIKYLIEKGSNIIHPTILLRNIFIMTASTEYQYFVGGLVERILHKIDMDSKIVLCSVDRYGNAVIDYIKDIQLFQELCSTYNIQHEYTSDREQIILHGNSIIKRYQRRLFGDSFIETLHPYTYYFTTDRPRTAAEHSRLIKQYL